MLRPLPSALMISALGVLLAFAGRTEGVDSIVYYVFAIVDQIGADPVSLLKPVYNPPPMYTHAYRPLSTALVKLGGALFARDLAGLGWLTFAHGLFLIFYGLAIRRFLSIHGFRPMVALMAALGSMLTPTILFSAWTIPEFDMVGGTVVLMAATEVHRGRLKAATPWLILAILTKETTAVLMFAYLLARALLSGRSKSHWALCCAYLAVLVLAVSPILLVKPPVTHHFNMADEEFEWVRLAWLFFHSLSQVFYVMGPAAAALIAYLAARRARVRSADWGLVALVAGMFLLTPLLRHYNHYESIIFSHWEWVLFWCVTAAAGLIALVFQGEGEERLLSLTVILGVGGLLAGPVLASFSRADLSARLLAPLIPILLGLACRGVSVAGSRAPTVRVTAGVAAIVLAWMPVAGAVSAWQFTQARFPVELAGKMDVLAALKSGCPMVFYTNRDQELAVEELQLLGEVPEEVAACTKLVQLATTELGEEPLWRYPFRLQGYDQYREEIRTDRLEHALIRRQAVDYPVHLYIQHARSVMGEDANTLLSADFEWATDRMPETDVGYFAQVMGVIYTVDTPIERFFMDAAVYKRRRAAHFFQLPMWLNELPRRLVLGVPLIERYKYQGALFSVPAGVRPLGQPEVVDP